MEKHDMNSQNQTNLRCSTWALIMIGFLISNAAFAVYEPSQLSDPSRRWSVDLGVSAGYDDNIHGQSQDTESSVTTTLNPRLAVNIPLDQTFLGLRYSYDWVYYWERTGGDKYDQSHVIDLIFSHRFTPRFQLDITDNFRRGISPSLVEIISGVEYIRQEQGDYCFNNLTTTLTYNLTRLWTLSVYNSWELWSYDNANAADQDRDVFSPGFSINYLLTPATTVGFNLRFGLVDYDDPGPNNEKNSTSITPFLFVSHLFNPQFSAQLSVGATMSETENNQESSSPYVSGSLTYRYSRNGTASIGASYFLYTHDQYGYRTAETMATYLQLSHAITQKLTARLGVTYIHSEMGSPSFDVPVPIADPSEDAWRFNIGATYAFTRWLFGEANYEYLHSSGIGGGSYDRNRVWAGLRFTY
ncbi:MAG: hypothetical protein FJ395_06575 [Verrucomicrobia bacterium]|nr:hypothetical protein [Verrucomicrobiota bacterium]